ncbi:hypothetical protein CesoFtcFv8_023750 [Champsocephalus esox]|uniref:Uncharacterized protein n=1 Tax=Champsocephalus esox TaxID=159716 RepID=A0AAN8B4G4_9TELE|nr:hypothetical protein CesoFtcFv8_023750 [Champsocephalus esox]
MSGGILKSECELDIYPTIRRPLKVVSRSDESVVLLKYLVIPYPCCDLPLNPECIAGHPTRLPTLSSSLGFITCCYPPIIHPTPAPALPPAPAAPTRYPLDGGVVAWTPGSTSPPSQPPLDPPRTLPDPPRHHPFILPP